MLAEFSSLESTWLDAVRQRDISTLEELLDESFVCTPWNSKGDLLLRGGYLDEVKEASFRRCKVEVMDVQMLDSFAIVKCRIQCSYSINNTIWKTTLLVTDIWVKKGDAWKALNRHASMANE